MSVVAEFYIILRLTLIVVFWWIASASRKESENVAQDSDIMDGTDLFYDGFIGECF